MRHNLTELIWNHSENQTFLQEDEWKVQIGSKLQIFEKQILTAMKSNGWDGDDNINTTQWTFAGSLFYSIIVITTIGKCSTRDIDHITKLKFYTQKNVLYTNKYNTNNHSLNELEEYMKLNGLNDVVLLVWNGFSVPI